MRLHIILAGFVLLLAGCDNAELLGIDTKLGEEDVKTKHLDDGAVTTRKLDDKSVTAPKIGSGDASAGRVLTSDGDGGATWEHPAGGGGLPVVDSTNIVFGSADNTKLLRFEVDGFTAGATRVMTPPDADITVAGINIAQTFTLKQTFSVAPTAPVGTQNQRFGEGAGAALGGGGQQNAFFGYNAATANTGSYNVAVGAGAMAANTQSINTAVGHQALSANTGDEYNVAVGAGAMKNHDGGDYNTAVGSNAMENAASGAGETSAGNVAIGGGAMRHADAASNNTCVGDSAGWTLGSTNVNSADSNVLIGKNAGDALDTGDANILLGRKVNASTAAASNEFVAGSSLYPVNNIYFGKGAVNAAPSAYTIHGTKSSANGTAGADIQIAGGLANQAADAGGSISFQTAAAGAGTALTTKVKINPAGIMNTYMGGDVLSAATIAPTGNVFKVTGNTAVTAISTAGITAGTRITMIFTGAPGPTMTDNDAALNLAGNFATTANDTLTLVYDGTNWIEVSRSVN